MSIQLDEINCKDSSGEILSAKEKRIRKNNITHLRGLGQAQTLLDQLINEIKIFDCEKIIPLYKKAFEDRKNDVKWLRRGVIMLSSKNCKESEIYQKMLKVWVSREKSIDAKIIFWDSFEKQVDSNTMEELISLIESEKDLYKKAEYFLRIAHSIKYSNKPTARNYAYRALKAKPSYGEAYLLIAKLYGSSANSCGTDEFSKRMVYVAAANMARKAKEVDPSIAIIADKYIKSYMANAPSDLWRISNKTFEIKCWIGETVLIP